MALVAYLSAVYIPFALMVGGAWFLGAICFRKARGGTWRRAIRHSLKEAAILVILIAAALLLLGLAAVLIGY